MAFPSNWTTNELITSAKLNEWNTKLSSFEKDVANDLAIATVSKVAIGATSSTTAFLINKSASDDMVFAVNSATTTDRAAFILAHYGINGTATPDNSRLGAIAFFGKGTDGSTIYSSAVIESYIGTNGTSNAAGDLRFYTNGGSGIVERFRVAADGTVTQFGALFVTGGTGGNNTIRILSPSNTKLYIQTTSLNSIISWNRDVVNNLVDDTSKAVSDIYLSSAAGASTINFRTSTTNGVSPTLRVTITAEGALKQYALTSTPSSPTAGTEANLYVKSNKLVIQYNDAGTVRYKYLDLSGAGVTWVHTTTAP